ncbi:hypothetical protein BJ912DRAFT_1140084 [Pholiota molesta]|nr:hypothetical protein BJ912DRAFT_1140084 [Pholiota molesta]
MDGLPTLNESGSIQETLRIIDESIAKQQKAIDELLKPLRDLKFHRNTIIPISRLPPELMCRIFSHAQVPHPTASEPNPLGWINLTYVCRHWRNIAISSPSLWVIPPIGNRKWVSEMLRRSKESSLVIRSDTEKSSTESGITLALRQIHRIKELSLRNFNSDAWNSIREMLPKSVPHLEHLCLHGVESDMGSGWEVIEPQPFVIWEDILCETENLRQLELDHVQLSWDSHSHLFHSLTHLKLKDLPRISLPSGKQLTTALKSMPDLEVLDLWDSLPNSTDQESSWGSENIHLIHLRSLSITSMFVEVEPFFRCVTFPPTAIVKIACRDDHMIRMLTGATNQNPNFSGFIVALARSYSATILDTTFHSIKLYRSGVSVFRLQFFMDALNLNEITNTTAIAHLELSLDFGAPNAARELMTDIFNSSIPLHNISCISLRDGISGLDSETIATTFGLKLPSLHSVMVSGNGARPFFNAMHLGTNVGLGDATRSKETPFQDIYFPYVSSIGLDDITFQGDMDTPTLPIELLQNFLIQRSELGAPIETLFMWDSSYEVHEEGIKSLMEIVVNAELEWNIKVMDEDCLLHDWYPMHEEDEGDEGEVEEEVEDGWRGWTAQVFGAGRASIIRFRANQFREGKNACGRVESGGIRYQEFYKAIE